MLIFNIILGIFWITIIISALVGLCQAIFNKGPFSGDY